MSTDTSFFNAASGRSGNIGLMIENECMYRAKLIFSWRILGNVYLLDAAAPRRIKNDARG